MTTTWVEALLRKRRETREEGVSPFPYQAAFLLNNPLRRTLFKSARIVESIGLTGSEHVLELGPGPGFYSVEIARRLTDGRLDLFDLQPEMLEKAKLQLERAGFRDVGFTVGQASQELPFPDNTFDTAFLAAVIGEVPDKQACLRSLGRVLKPGGRLVFAETYPDPDRLSVQELRDLAEPENFEFVEATGNRWRDVVTFRNRGSTSPTSTPNSA
jgi:ubiquinone/menaquinone biosynthesis C-methylase UbiE